jgi:c-di-GMP-binding flagellar brake protein YcgR
VSLRKLTTTVKKRKGGDKSQFKEGVFVVERRRQPRINVELPLGYSLVDKDESHGGIAADISEGGLLIYLPEAIPIGTSMRIEILFVRGFELSSIKAITKVVWSDLPPKATWGEYRYGLEFQSFQEGDFQKLKRLIKEVSESHYPKKKR